MSSPLTARLYADWRRSGYPSAWPHLLGACVYGLRPSMGGGILYFCTGSAMPQAQANAVAPRKRNGAYYTPDGVAGMLVRWAVRSPGDRLLDPSCGDGRFLVTHGNSVGVERTPEAVGEAKARAPQARVCQAEFFAWAEQAHEAGERFDCVVGNPPFIRYQTWGRDVRTSALDLCRRFGVAFSGLAASWAPFLAVSANLLRPSGRMAFVVPAAFGHAPYAGPLVEHLVARFQSVRIVAVRRRLFPRLFRGLLAVVRGRLRWFDGGDEIRRRRRHSEVRRAATCAGAGCRRRVAEQLESAAAPLSRRRPCPLALLGGCAPRGRACGCQRRGGA